MTGWLKFQQCYDGSSLASPIRGKYQVYLNGVSQSYYLGHVIRNSSRTWRAIEPGGKTIDAAAPTREAAGEVLAAHRSLTRGYTTPQANSC